MVTLTGSGVKWRHVNYRLLEEWDYKVPWLNSPSLLSLLGGKHSLVLLFSLKALYSPSPSSDKKKHHSNAAGANKKDMSFFLLLSFLFSKSLFLFMKPQGHVCFPRIKCSNTWRPCKDHKIQCDEKGTVASKNGVQYPRWYKNITNSMFIEQLGAISGHQRTEKTLL